VEALLDSLGDESQRIFFISVVTAFILGIALVVVVFISRIKFLKNRIFDAKEIDIAKNKKISDLKAELKEVRIKDEALEEELKQFNDTKVALQSKKELIFKMQERMNLLEEKDKEQLDTIEACSKEYQTLVYKYKSLQKRNVFLVEENTRFRTENTKILMKVREQERRIFEKLMSLQGNTQKQRQEIGSLAEGIIEKNRNLFDALRHEKLMSQILPLSEEMLLYQKEIVSSLRKSLGREGDMQNDIAAKVESKLKIGESVKTMIEKMRDEARIGEASGIVAAYLLKLSGLEKREWMHIERSETGEKEVRLLKITLPDSQSLTIDTTFSIAAYEIYRQTTNRKKRAIALDAYLDAFEKHVDSISKSMPDQGQCWMLVPISEALQVACRHEKRICDMAAKKGIMVIDASTFLALLESVAILWEYQRHYRFATELLSKAEAIQQQFETYGEEISSVAQRLEMMQGSLYPEKPQ